MDLGERVEQHVTSLLALCIAKLFKKHLVFTKTKNKLESLFVPLHTTFTPNSYNGITILKDADGKLSTGTPGEKALVWIKVNTDLFGKWLTENISDTPTAKEALQLFSTIIENGSEENAAFTKSILHIFKGVYNLEKIEILFEVS